jgi:cyanate permease
MNSLYITAVTFLVTQIFDYGGMSRDEAVSIFLPSAIVAVIMHFTGSFLSDYMKLKYFLILHLAGMMLSMAGIMFISHDVVWMIIAGNGISSAMFGILSAITWPRFYGTKHLGEISGSAMGWMVAGSAVGPFLFSLSKKLTESYFAAAFLCFIITFIIFALGFKADNVNESESFDGS